MDRRSIYDMDLHEILDHFADDLKTSLAYSVIRVPGGWIYSSFDKGNQIGSSVFVPFDNEFMNKTDK